MATPSIAPLSAFDQLPALMSMKQVTSTVSVPGSDSHDVGSTSYFDLQYDPERRVYHNGATYTLKVDTFDGEHIEMTQIFSSKKGLLTTRFEGVRTGEAFSGTFNSLSRHGEVEGEWQARWGDTPKRYIFSSVKGADPILELPAYFKITMNYSTGMSYPQNWYFDRERKEFQESRLFEDPYPYILKSYDGRNIVITRSNKIAGHQWKYIYKATKGDNGFTGTWTGASSVGIVPVHMNGTWSAIW
jgi:hypothetical protein